MLANLELRLKAKFIRTSKTWSSWPGFFTVGEQDTEYGEMRNNYRL